MRTLTPQRRAAAICAACSAVIPSTSLLMFSSHSSPAHFFGGLIVGLAITLCIGSLALSRRSCA